MTYTIYKQGMDLGRIADPQGQRMDLTRVTDETLRSIILKAGRTGIVRVHEVLIQGYRLHVEAPVAVDQPTFWFSLKGWLQRQGYDICVEYPELDQDILRRCAQLDPNVMADVKLFLPRASYLEKTYLLEQLTEPDTPFKQ